MKKHILLIEKDKDELNIFMQAFKDVEFPLKCTYTECWRHATEMLTYLSVDAIFVHLDPDVTDHLEFVRKLKKQKKFRHTPIVVYSENMRYYNFLSRGHGADHCIAKPADGDTIKKTVAAVLAV